MTDENLNMCSLSTQGVYIKLMCILHKQKEYGVILLKQKDKQSESTYLNFANKIAKLLPIGANEIKIAISELVEEDVLIIEGDKLFQKRMVKDNEISEARSKAGKKGGETTQSKKEFAKAKSEANSEDEDENEDESIIGFNIFWNLYDKKVGSKSKIKKKWDKLSTTTHQCILEYIPKYKLSQPDKQYRKHPETFFNNESWKDEIINNNGTHQQTSKRKDEGFDNSRFKTHNPDNQVN